MTRRDRTMLGALALIAVLGGFFMLVVKPAREDLAALDEQKIAAEQRRDTALSNLASARQAREQYRRDQATLAVLGKAVPADDSVPSLLYQLNHAARKAKIDFRAVTVGEGAAAAAPAAGSASATAGQAQDATPGTMPGPDGLTRLPLKITFSGTFFQLERFLKSVHGFARFEDDRLNVVGRLLTIDGVGLTPSEGGTSTLKAEISGSAYIAANGAATGTAAAAPGSASGTESGSGSAATPGKNAPAPSNAAETTS